MGDIWGLLFNMPPLAVVCFGLTHSLRQVEGPRVTGEACQVAAAVVKRHVHCP